MHANNVREERYHNIRRRLAGKNSVLGLLQHVATFAGKATEINNKRQ